MKKKVIPVLLLIFAFMMLSGMEILNNPMELNPDERIVYKFSSLSGIEQDVAGKANNTDYAFSGKIENIARKYDRFDIRDEEGNILIECKTSETAVKNEVAELSEGDEVTVLSSVKKKLVGSGLTANISKLDPGKSEASFGDLISDGRIYSKDNTETVIIEEEGSRSIEKVTYRIPKEWKRVEKKLDDKGGHIYGYQYRLNKIRGQSTPESLYIFYFDYNKNLTDKSRYDEKSRIEAAIVRNILGKEDVGRCPESVIRASYGPDYHYYDDKYESGDDLYHLEFVFRPYEEKGMLVYMYIYREPDRAGEIMQVMRTTDIKTEAVNDTDTGNGKGS